MSSLPKQVLKQIERMRDAYDPLIITLRSGMFWTENYYDICCRNTIRIDENYIQKGKEEQNPKSKLYDKRCKLYSKVKYVILKVV